MSFLERCFSVANERNLATHGLHTEISVLTLVAIWEYCSVRFDRLSSHEHPEEQLAVASTRRSCSEEGQKP